MTKSISDDKTRNPLTPDELRQWLAGRGAAGRQIDIETCTIVRIPACDFDPYGIRRMLGEEPYISGATIFSSGHPTAMAGYGMATYRLKSKRPSMPALNARRIRTKTIFCEKKTPGKRFMPNKISGGY